MRILRALGGAVLWIVASVVCLIALVLCVTIVLLPLGIPLLMLGRKLFGQSVRLFLPRALRHPAKATGEGARSTARSAAEGISEQLSNISLPDRKKADKLVKKARKRWKKVAHA